MGFSFNIKKSANAGQVPPARPKRKLNKWELDTIQPDQKKPALLLCDRSLPTLRQKQQPSEKLSNIFGEIEDDDIENNPLKKTSNTEGRVRNLKSRQEKVEKKIAEIMKEDPNAFAYDEVYDKMVDGRKQIEDRRQKDKIQRKAKYVPTLLKHAVTRNKLHEAARERQWARKENAINDVYEGKEKFVTSAYKEHLSEQERLRKLEELVDQQMDTIATKGNMQSFYENMLNKRLGVKDDRVRPQLAGFNVELHQDEEADAVVSKEKNIVGDKGREVLKSSRKLEGVEHPQPMKRSPSRTDERVDVRRRRANNVKDQLKEIEKQRATKKKKKRRLKETVQKKEDLMSAKERFLARKKARLQEVMEANDL